MWYSFWRDDSGSVNSAELILIMTLLTIGSLVGTKSLRDSTVTEFADLAQALANVDQTYTYSALTVITPDGTAVTTPFGFEDSADFCDTELVSHQQSAPGSKCIFVAQPPSSSAAGGETGLQ
jgi:hypothetical protein